MLVRISEVTSSLLDHIFGILNHHPNVSSTFIRSSLTFYSYIKSVNTLKEIDFKGLVDSETRMSCLHFESVWE